MTSRIAIVVPAVFLALPAPALADDFQQWVGYSAKVDLSDKVNLQHETQFRFSNDRNGLFQIQSSLLVGYKLTPDVVVAAGYLHSPAYSAGDFTSMERRFREQITFDELARIGGAKLGGRLRFEQRWRDDQDGTAWRVRPSAKLTVPLGDKQDPSLVLSEEAFFNLNTTPLQRKEGLERLRTTALLSVPVAKALKLEGGYIHQHRFVTNAPNVDEHVLNVMLNFSF